MLDAIVVGVGRAVEPAELVVEDPGEFECKLVGTGGKRFGKGDRDPFELVVVRDLASNGDTVECGCVDRELDRVEHEFGHGLAHVDIDHHRAGETCTCEVRPQREFIVTRSNRSG